LGLRRAPGGQPELSADLSDVALLDFGGGGGRSRLGSAASSPIAGRPLGRRGLGLHRAQQGLDTADANGWRGHRTDPGGDLAGPPTARQQRSHELRG
jgi:hypothetical protein